MTCLLAAATAKEITPFLDHYRTSGNKAGIDILITGIGLTAATYSLVKQIELNRPDLIIQAGIAGCFDQNIPLGSVVVIQKDTIADLSVVENKQLTTMFDLGLVAADQFPFKKGWLVNPNKELLRQSKRKAVTAISVNHITTNRQMLAMYEKKFSHAIESMEGAALHYTCLQERIPFLQLRSISNYIGERDKKKWNMKDAIVNLNKEIINLTTHLKL